MTNTGEGGVAFPHVGIETRLDEVCRLLGGRGKAAVAAGVSPQMLRRYVSGDSQPGFDVVARLAAASGVSLDWLATGRGEMLPGANAAQTDVKPAAPIDLVEEGARRFLSQQAAVTGNGAGGLTHEQLVEQAALVVGRFCEAQGWARNPEKEALLISLLVSRFEFEGHYSQEAADRLLKLAG